MRSKSECSLSIIDTTNITGSRRATASRNIRSVPTSTPDVAGTTTSAPSAAARPAIASPWKSRYPGVSRRLILVSCHSANAGPTLIEYPRSISSAAWSVSAVPSFTDPCRFELPDTKASASTKLVLPLAPCPTTAMLRISDPLYSLIASTPLLSKQCSDIRCLLEPRAKGVVADRVVERRELHGERAPGVPRLADAVEDQDAARTGGAPESSQVIGEYADAVGRAVCGASSRHV